MPETIVTLKVNGKAFACDVRLGKRRCGCKTFAYDRPFDNESGLIGPPVYVCTACKSSHPHRAGIEALLPPRNDWRTPGGTAMAPKPGELWTTLHEEYGYNLDLAADSQNTKCDVFFDGVTPESDALKVNWHGNDLARLMGYHSSSIDPEHVRAHSNPPYTPNGVIETWLQKALEQCAQGVFSTWLIPMSSSVGWFNELVVPYAEWHTFYGRIAFEDPLASNDHENTERSERTSPKQDNLFVIYDPRSNIVGHTAVRHAKTGKRVWTRPDLLENHEIRSQVRTGRIRCL